MIGAVTNCIMYRIRFAQNMIFRWSMKPQNYYLNSTNKTFTPLYRFLISSSSKHRLNKYLFIETKCPNKLNARYPINRHYTNEVQVNISFSTQFSGNFMLVHIKLNNLFSNKFEYQHTKPTAPSSSDQLSSHWNHSEHGINIVKIRIFTKWSRKIEVKLLFCKSCWKTSKYSMLTEKQVPNILSAKFLYAMLYSMLGCAVL